MTVGSAVLLAGHCTVVEQQYYCSNVVIYWAAVVESNRAYMYKVTLHGNISYADAARTSEHPIKSNRA
jgi:hypothetical protein